MMAFNINDYETVEVRLGRFIADNPDFMVHTELLEHSEKRFIVLAKIYRTCVDSQPFATGLAYETISDRGVNQTSALENCETSAIGRSLANAGYAAKGKRPSQSEMVKVIAAEDAPKTFKEKLESRTYGAAGSRSAAVEDALRSSFAADKTEPEPVAWSVGDLVDAIPANTPLPMPCENGKTKLMQGISKGGKPYYGYVCGCGKPKDQQCKAQWATLSANGRWFFKDDGNG
jgi:hypothetical protein